MWTCVLGFVELARLATSWRPSRWKSSPRPCQIMRGGWKVEDWGDGEGRAAEMVERVRRVVSRESIRATGIMSEGRLIEVGSLRERER